ncbi:hypothetical protein GCM10011505_18580 [Tistrella bauzanensis]|uniref:RES domain-containing protein n=1 Tax=Tistrella bauzanensis TaxID=657419 RepID=A0ABQ1IGT6_9PROT|nr:RES family NAD+ phosphorylase [Tistrella bauzanensis]GGB37400.1 hypothetical protein GCM10011505_18580 [Tistrella bauzanensis]
MSGADAPAPPVVAVTWLPAYRIIPSRFPPIHLFERITDPADLEAVFAIEAMTNPRLRDEAGDIALVAPADRVSGPGSSVIMAAFTHPNPAGSRFADGSIGAFYAARALDTAIAETSHHRARFMAATAEPAMELDMRVYLVDLAGRLHDLRGLGSSHAAVYHHSDYSAGQALAAGLRRQGADGIAYDSVRHPGGECAAVFRPPVLGNVRQGAHLCYVWDGRRINLIYEKRLLA